MKVHENEPSCMFDMVCHVWCVGLKANVSEADHPLLCEGTRRQRGDLAVTMLVHYKDDQLKLTKVDPGWSQPS